ncbi:MAG TPA: HD domain-containing protein [Tepidisphaeraceae bacterium]|nr:HD domain-containing protein [Tepidisphaeraceae bacterium]
MRRLYLKDCVAGDIVEDVFVVANKQFAPTQTGKYFIKAFVSDRSAQLNARMWNATRDIFNAMPESGFLKIRGRIENYQSNLQLIIEQMWPAKQGTFDIQDLIPHTSKNIDQMYARLCDLIGSIQNRHIAAILQTYLDDESLMARFRKAPAAMNMHHAYIGGLLEHTLNAMEVADAIIRFYPGLNRDLVLAGIFLHDIAKTWELCYDCAFGYTDGGQLVGHIVKSAIWLEQRARAAEQMLGEQIPQNLIDVLQHIIISHHGTPEFGAIKPPSTPEAIAVHFIENMDAKLMMALSSTRTEAPDAEPAGSDGTGEQGNWTEYLKAFGGKLYRPDVAPAEVGEGRPLADSPAPTAAPAHSPDQSSATPTLKLEINNPLFESVKKSRK